MKKFGIPAIVTVILGAVYYYFSLPALNIRSPQFWSALLFLAIVYFLSYLFCAGKLHISSLVGRKAEPKLPDFSKWKRLRIPVIAVVCVGVVVGLAIAITSARLFNAKKYQKLLTVSESNFSKDIAEISFSQIPVVDKDSASRLGSRKIGEVVELVSQFNVSAYYTQINYNTAPTRVSPLEYAGFLKWFFNRSEGIPYYVKIDMATQTTELVKLSEGIKYSPSEYFNRDLIRHIRFKYPTKMLDEVSFEVNDEGHPYWVVSYYTYSFGFIGGRDIAGAIVVDAITGETTDYPVAEVPQWIDQVYPADLVLEQTNYWGAYQNGFWNSIFNQKNVVRATEGYNYLAIDDDVWLFTGITSVVSDESNIGFILINLRTKESRMYSINGAEEFSAMASAEGMIQEKGYKATFPILLNIANRPTYFISLKDNAGLVKAYAFVSVEQYQIVGVADTIEGAQAEYLRLLGDEGTQDNADDQKQEVTVTGTIEQIQTAVVEGYSVYYIKIDGAVYTAKITAGDQLPFFRTGDRVALTLSQGETIARKAEYVEE